MKLHDLIDTISTDKQIISVILHDIFWPVVVRREASLHHPDGRRVQRARVRLRQRARRVSGGKERSCPIQFSIVLSLLLPMPIRPCSTNVAAPGGRRWCHVHEKNEPSQPSQKHHVPSADPAGWWWFTIPQRHTKKRAWFDISIRKQSGYLLVQRVTSCNATYA